MKLRRTQLSEWEFERYRGPLKDTTDRYQKGGVAVVAICDVDLNEKHTFNDKYADPTSIHARGLFAEKTAEDFLPCIRPVE